jgi:uncharacterized protein (TIGR02145 family)
MKIYLLLLLIVLIISLCLQFGCKKDETTSPSGTAPQAPTLSSPQNDSTNLSITPTLVWYVSESALTYTLQISTDSIFSILIYNESGLTVTSKQITGLSNCAKYYWRVNATNVFGTSIWSSVWNFLTQPASKPSSPTLQLPTNGSIDQSISPTLTWQGSTCLTSYTLQVSIDSLFSSYIYNFSNLTSTTYQTSGLSNATTYYWRVSATNIFGASELSEIWNFTTTFMRCPSTPTVIYSGKTYNTVQIGNQCWLKENLDVGTRINGSQNQTNNGSIEKYCYSDDQKKCNSYGGLYQWDEAMKYSTVEGAQGICPGGWHIPTAAEFDTLIAAVLNNGNTLKAVGQGIGNGSGTNMSGFSALLSGFRDYYGTFNFLGVDAIFWASSIYGVAPSITHIALSSEFKDIYTGGGPKQEGFSVRCLKN